MDHCLFHNKHRVLQLLYKLEVGGAERVACSLAKGLDKSKYETVVAAFKGGSLARDLLTEEIPLLVLDKKNGLDLRFLVRFARLLREQHIDIIHSHTFSPNFWARAFGRLLGIPIVVTTEHTIASHKSGLQRLIDRHMSHWSSRTVAVSHAVKEGLVKKVGMGPAGITVIHNGVAAPSISSNSESLFWLREQLGLQSCNPVFLTVGRLAEAKGHVYLLEAAAIVVKTFPKARFILAGDGPLLGMLERRATELGIQENTIFAGHRDDVPSLLDLSNIVVMPSIREGFSIFLLEAMAAGKPIVATDVGGNKEAIDPGISGILIPARAVKALYDAMLKVAEDSELALSLGLNAKEKYMTNYSIKAMVTKTEDLYESLIHNSYHKRKY